MPDSAHRLSLDAPAKINLYLHITGRRDDGYHLLDSLIAFTEYGDRVFAEPADGLSLQIDGPFATGLAVNDDNLIVQAARALRDAFGISEGAILTLQKNLPVSSGIGGGSADAAAALRLLSRLWGIDADDEELSRIGLSIGADVPVCIAGVPCRMTGVGEIISPVEPFPDCPVLLVNGGEAVSTPAVFAARQGEYSGATDWRAPGSFDEFVSCLQPLSNDLAAAARRISPVTGEVLSALHDAEGCAMARLSGSGGTCFGLFTESALAESARKAIEDRQSGWWSVATRFRDVRPEIATG